MAKNYDDHVRQYRRYLRACEVVRRAELEARGTGDYDGLDTLDTLIAVLALAFPAGASRHNTGRTP